MRAALAPIVAAVAILSLPQAAGAEHSPQSPQTPNSGSAAVAPQATTGGSRPLVAADAAYATSETTANVEGNANPEGSPTTIRAAYALAKEPWCTSGGTKGKPSAKTPLRSIGSGRSMISEIIVKLHELTPGTRYCVELVATNHFGTSHSKQLQFATPDELAQGAPASRGRPPGGTPRTPPGPPSPSATSAGWPAPTIAALVALAAVLLSSLALIARSRFRGRRTQAPRPAAG